MTWNYECPHCRSMLNPHTAIMLIGQHGEDRHLVGFHPSPGNYEIFFPPSANIVRGDLWSFFCPVCHQDLAVDYPEKMCAIGIRTPREVHKVFFSRVAGDQATFVVENEAVLESHGVDADRYNLEKAQMKYLL